MNPEIILLRGGLEHGTMGEMVSGKTGGEND
jgi:hypothetical protein